MRVNKYLLPIVVVVTLFAAVFVAQAAGFWQTSGREMINLEAGLTSADIRGWMSLELLAEGFDLPPAELLALLGLPADTPAVTSLKDLEGIIETSEVRAILAAYGGEALPADEHDAAEPAATATAEPSATPTPVAEPTALPTHQPGANTGAGDGTGAGPTPLPAGQILPAADIKGRMTLQEVSEQCGVPLATLYEELGLPADTVPADTPLRDVSTLVPTFTVEALRALVADYQAVQP